MKQLLHNFAEHIRLIQKGDITGLDFMAKDRKKGDKQQSAQREAQPSGGGGVESNLPAHLELQRTRVICGPDINFHVRSLNEFNTPDY